ncbi:class I SAM-dependent methyltransferase [Rubellicoccus peritrichatus]|uniref:Class I SAM-dependent methyltransferase n=1 Tax=Rubellicoccus peritrichatus TaxID=3080537 RepID=A0AAQ3LBW9_9BACT|nr:class I SAM-dependent methyltransferase [Puniceicoccus sp. CR14]WOO42921.1 class I SAM-dependent methyltransferase [Puniceicoccus sp. CR14]
MREAQVSSDYEHYREWKGWGGGLGLEKWKDRYFAGEIQRAGLEKSATILEIGFGDGEFLGWARKNGFNATGIEIIPQLVEVALSNGFDAHLYDIVSQDSDSKNPLSGRHYDAVFAFDVVEHLTPNQAKVLFQKLAKMLRPGGRVILRFPNGESLFYIPVQNGDYTHRMHVCQLKLEHLCLGTGLKLMKYSNAYRVANKRSTAWMKYLFFLFRDLVEIFIGYLYYNRRRPLDPVATAVLILCEE